MLEASQKEQSQNNSGCEPCHGEHLINNAALAAQLQGSRATPILPSPQTSVKSRETFK